MLSFSTRTFAVSLAMLVSCGTAAAQPVTLKLAYFSSDRTTNYVAAMEPFVTAVNREGAGIVEIDVYPSGALGDDVTRQLDLVLDGTADIAFIVPGYTRERFGDTMVVEFPGIVADVREATLLYTDLIAANALRGYDDLYVIGALATGIAGIHSREPIASVGELTGKRIRANNSGQGAALARLGAIPVFIPFTEVTAAIGTGDIDGVAVNPVPLFEFGIGRVAAHHYYLPFGVAPLAIVMSRARFDALPPAAQDIVARHSGRWTAEQFIAAFEIAQAEATATLTADAGRTVVMPGSADLEIAQRVFDAVMADWQAADPHNAAVLAAARTMLQGIRAGQQ